MGLKTALSKYYTVVQGFATILDESSATPHGSVQYRGWIRGVLKTRDISDESHTTQQVATERNISPIVGIKANFQAESFELHCIILKSVICRQERACIFLGPRHR